MKLPSTKTHHYIYLFALALLVASLPFSLFLISISQFILILNWLTEGNLKGKFIAFFKNKPAIIFSLLFFLHIVGLIYTSDFTYAFKDIRTKIPLLLLPLIISTSKPLLKKELNALFFVFIAAVIVATFINTYYYFNHVINDIRETSRFISHIRFSLMICFSIVLALYYLLKEKITSKLTIIIIVILLLWLLAFLLLSESITGISILTILVLFFLLKTVFSKTAPLFRLASALVILFIFSYAYFYINGAVKEYYHKNPVSFSSLDTITHEGNPYINDTTSLESENGNLIWIYISKEELADEWTKRSNYNFNGFDDKNQRIEFTLIRYLTSKGLRKDADGLKQLSDDEIVAIQKGITSVSFFEKMTLKKRIHQILGEFDNYKKDGNANGLSVMLKVEFVKASIGIIKEHFVFGVGTGDVNIAFKEQYEKTHSLLKPENRWRSHNQYLSLWVAFGIIGFIVFIFSLFSPPVLLKKFRDYRYLAFFIIIIISMLTEDTLETQVGVTFYAFFSSLFLFGTSNKNDE